MQVTFDGLVRLCRRFPVKHLASEADLERSLSRYLDEHGVRHTTQVTERHNRYDVICGEICIELKMHAAASDLDQFDRYLPRFPKGLIILCWTAAPSVRGVAATVAAQSPTPVALVELAAFHSPV